LVIQELEKALNIHEEWECEQKLPKDYERIREMIEHPESQIITKKDLYSLLSSGTCLNNGKVWLSLSKDGKVKEMISATMFSYENCWSFEWKVLENSRFGTVAEISDTSYLNIPINIKTQFLSLGIVYGAYLVFRFCDPKTVSSEPYVKLEYSIASEDLYSYVAVRRDDGWMMIELCRFGNHTKITEFKVDLEESVGRSINADSSINRDQQSSIDFQEITKRSQYDVLTITKQELDNFLSTGVLIDNGKKGGSTPVSHPTSSAPDAEYSKCQPSATSRFEEVVKLQRHQAFSINCNIETIMLSPDTAYACYLVFQHPENIEGLKCPVKVRDLLNKNNKESTIIYLKTPFPVDLYRYKRVPENREDGWMEVTVWEFVYNNEIKDNYIPMKLKLACLGGTMSRPKYTLGMERGFLSQKGSGMGRGVKEKSLKASDTEVVKDGVVPYVYFDSENVAKEVISPCVVDKTLEKEKQNSLVDTTLESYPPLSTQGATTASNTPSKSSYANVTGKPSGTKLNFHTLFKSGGWECD
ncbi:phloem protein 2-like protein, partial [Tanacetum coccineum]